MVIKAARLLWQGSRKPTQQRHTRDANEGRQQHRQQRAAECAGSICHKLGFIHPQKPCR